MVPEEIRAGRDALHEVVGPEPADWRIRLAGRGAVDGELERLLAICRSADGHAYQLLEKMGANCSKLRKAVIERLRARAIEPRTVARARVHPPVSPPSGASTGAPVRTSRPRHGVSSEPPARLPLIRAGRSQPEALPEQPARESPAVLQALDPDALPELHGRATELRRLADALSRKTVRAPLLIGAPGSGRTTLAIHLATMIAAPIFRVSATGYDEQPERFERDLDHVAKASGILIFDDLDRVPSESAPAFLGALAHAINTGAPKVLTIVSPEGHGRLCAWLPGAMESADALVLAPLRGSALEAAVKASAPSILQLHGIELASDAKLGELTRLAERYLTGMAMPARALDLLDLAAARARREGASAIPRRTWVEIVAERSGLTVGRIELRGDQDTLDLEQRIADRVVGHDSALHVIASLIRRNRAGFGGQRPMLSALLLGPSGVGKTEIAKALGQALFDRDDAVVRLDMSEYAESHAVARIVGAPPGYVGHDQGGALSDPLRTRPHCVVLLDEIEKAHRDVHQLLLQVFDEGHLTDGRGRTIDFRHCAIIMTSNLGSNRWLGGPVARMDEDAVLGEARRAFPLELWNRIEAPLVMHPLTPAELGRICRRLSEASSARLFRERGIRYQLDDKVCDHLVALAGRDPGLGARPLRHLLVREIESKLAEAVLRGRLRAGSDVLVTLDRRGTITIGCNARPGGVV